MISPFHVLVLLLLITGFLTGIRLMQSQKTALWGNRLGGLCMTLAIVFTLQQTGLLTNPLSWLCIGVGVITGITLGQSVRMIQMPQMVALLNGLGGLASALVAGFATISPGGEDSGLFWLTALPALAVGALTFSGSVVATLKLQGFLKRHAKELLFSRHFPGGALLFGILVLIAGIIMPQLYYPALIFAIVIVFSLYGFLMAMRVGGGDMPILIAFLNSFSGVAAAVCGLAVDVPLLTGVGAMVGVAGLILTSLMCRAMNRSLPKVLGGFVPFVPTGEHKQSAGSQRSGEDREKLLARVLRSAGNVIIVPGYGMAAARAQTAVKDLVNALEEKGKTVKIAVHPVAGRMPGHMHVLLAEAGIDQESVLEIDTVNPQFPDTDLVIAVGACDVINPVAVTEEKTPIYGMPILHAEEAKNVIVCNLDAQPGYSGVENTLYEREHVIGFWGDASETIPELKTILLKE